jgi:hypothetical protein
MSNTDRSAAPKRKGGGIPPLAWIIIGLLLGVALIAFLTMDGAQTGPSGGPAMPVDLPEAPTAIEPAGPVQPPTPNPRP